MRDKYRFTLQWGTETAEKISAGELLKSFGNRKSEFIVAAITEYIRLHPEMPPPDQNAVIVVKPNFTQGQIETMIKTIIDERLGNAAYSTERGNTAETVSASKDDIDMMIGNLDLFTS